MESTEDIGSGECPWCGRLLTVSRSGWGECADAECGFEGSSAEPDDGRAVDDSRGADGVGRQPTPDMPEGLRRTRKLQLLARANCQCEEPGCSVRHAPPRVCLEMHHIVARRHGGSHDLENLELLCRYHHSIRTKAENESDELRASMNTEFRPKIDVDWEDHFKHSAFGKSDDD